MGSGGSDWKWGESQASGIVPSQNPPHIQYHKATKQYSDCPLPWRLPKAPPHTMYQVHQDRESKQLYLIHRNKHREAAKLRRQRNMAQMKEKNKIPEEELNETEIANRNRDTEFNTLAIRMLRELLEYGRNIKKRRLH